MFDPSKFGFQVSTDKRDAYDMGATAGQPAWAVFINYLGDPENDQCLGIFDELNASAKALGYQIEFWEAAECTFIIDDCPSAKMAREICTAIGMKKTNFGI